MSDAIQKTMELNAPIDKVWRAISDHRSFSAWFRVDLEEPFEVGKTSRGRMTYPGYEHIVWTADVVAVEPPRLFAFTWRPYAIDPNVDYSGEEPTTTGTRLTVTESGFDKVPAHLREEAFRMNDRGWTQQMKNIETYVTG